MRNLKKIFTLLLLALALTGCSVTEQIANLMPNSTQEISDQAPSDQTTQDKQTPAEEEPGGAPKTEVEVPQGFETFESKEISLSYPKDWAIQEGVMGSSVMVMSPQKDKQDPFQENLNIMVQDLSQSPMTLDQFTQLSVEQIPEIITEGDITVEASDTKLSGMPAKKITYTGKQGKYDLKWFQVWTIKDNKAYIATYTSVADEYDTYLDTAQVMIDTLVIK